MFQQDLAAIDQLRADAVSSVDVHPSAINKLTTYAAQLVFMGTKFPIDVGHISRPWRLSATEPCAC